MYKILIQAKTNVFSRPGKPKNINILIHIFETIDRIVIWNQQNHNLAYTGTISILSAAVLDECSTNARRIFRGLQQEKLGAHLKLMILAAKTLSWALLFLAQGQRMLLAVLKTGVASSEIFQMKKNIQNISTRLLRLVWAVRCKINIYSACEIWGFNLYSTISRASARFRLLWIALSSTPLGAHDNWVFASCLTKQKV